MLAKTDEVRRQFARLSDAPADEIGFLFATSEGENIIANALNLRAGDNVVIDESHYDTTFVLYRHLATTRIVSVSWVSHQNGFRHEMRPLADLAHAHGAFFYRHASDLASVAPEIWLVGRRGRGG